MRFALLAIAAIVLFLAAAPRLAAAAEKLQPGVTAAPACFEIRNTASYRILGSVATDLYRADGGESARHRSNFRLMPNEREKFCTTGPFYEGRRLELVLRTFVPVFSCKFSVDMGVVVVRSGKDPEGRTKTWAECGR